MLAPPVVKLSHLSMTVYENASFELTCVGLVPDTGHPDVGGGVTFTWDKDGIELKKESKILFFLLQHLSPNLKYGCHK